MKIVGSYDLAGLPMADGEPTVVDWQWYHNLPGLPFWILLAVMVGVLKAVRDRTGRIVVGLLLGAMLLAMLA